MATSFVFVLLLVGGIGVAGVALVVTLLLLMMRSARVQRG